MGRFIDLTGHIFGRLAVIERAENKGIKTMWLCECSCGNRKVIAAGDLSSGRTQSCGCFRKEVVTAKNYVHGHTNERLNSIWRNMKKRCYNPKCKSFKDYGGRGISICDEWRDDFMTFYNWAADNGYSDDLTIDRKDNDKNYGPLNCRWVNRKIQNINQRLRKDNSTGIKGVYWNKNLQKYKATMSLDGKQVDLGAFDDLGEAGEVRREAEEKYYGYDNLVGSTLDQSVFLFGLMR